MAIGRPRAFDMDQALDRALEVFWRKGYEGTTICDLTAAMGINPPSLYAAFGNKEGLFRKALDRYGALRTAFWEEALNAPTARAVAETLLLRHGQVPVRSAPSQGMPCRARRARLVARRPTASARSSRRAVPQTRVRSGSA